MKLWEKQDLHDTLEDKIAHMIIQGKGGKITIKEARFIKYMFCILNNHFDENWIEEFINTPNK